MTRAVRENAPALVVGLVLAYALKAAFSRLGPDGLRFMTGPVQALVGLATGIDFEYEAGYGYVSFARRLVIAKSCTGVNFLLAVFGLLVATVVPEVSGRLRKVWAVGALAIAAYAVAVAVNAVRISLGVALHEGGWEWAWLDAGRVHRLAGIGVYLAALVGVHALARRGLATAATPLLAGPLAAYAAVTVVVPLLNGAASASPRLFAENCAWIALVGAAGLGAARLARRWTAA